jgi:hypothetical protein
VRGFADPDLRVMWCDGLVPEQYDLRSAEPRITGRAYFGASGQEPCRFTLLVGDSVSATAHLDWVSLLPDEGVTGWLTPRPTEQRLIVAPLCQDRQDPRPAHAS